jgi:hypothetical protein
MDNDDLVITIETDTLSIDTSTYSTYNTGDIILTSNNGMQVYDINNTWTSIGDLTTDTIDLSSISITEPVEFEDTMPDVAKVEDMCNDYPALAKAYENFKNIYNMVHQDWVGKQKEDELPF